MSQFTLEAKLGAGYAFLLFLFFLFLAYLHHSRHGKVYRAKHLDTGFVLAIKGLPLLAADRAAELAARERIVQTIGRLQHSNLVGYFGSGIQKGSLWVCCFILFGLLFFVCLFVLLT